MAKDPLIHYLEDRSGVRFAALVAARRTDVLNAAWRATGDADLAEDIAQDTLLKLLDLKLDPGEVRSPKGLLVTMTVNEARSRQRSAARRRGREEVAVRRREERGGMDPEQVDELREAVADLPEEQRECVELRYFGGLSLGDVAKTTGLALRTVSQKLKDARDRLRVRLADAAFSAPLAFLAGEQERGLPTIEPSRRFVDKTDRLAPMPTVARKKGAALVLGACALLVIAFGIFHEQTADHGGVPEPEKVAGTFAPDGGKGGPARLGEPGERVASHSSERKEEEGEPSGAAEETIGFLVRVVDEEGYLLRDGQFELDLDGIPDFDQIEKLKAWRGLLRVYSLAETNPLEVTGLPPAAEGLALEVSATAPGRPPSVVTEFKVQTGKKLVVTVVVPLPRELPVLVLDRFTKQPIAGAAVISKTELRRRKIDPELAMGTEGPGATTTGPDGRCRLGGLGDEPHDLEVSAAGYEAGALWDLPLTKEAQFLLESIKDAGVVIATVVDIHGDPVVGAPVSLDVDQGSVDAVRKTDEQGSCRFEGVAPGFHAIHVDYPDPRHHDQLVTRLSFELKPGEERTIGFGAISRTHRLTVVVLDAAAKPKPGVKVELWGETLDSKVSDGEGRVVFANLPSDDYRAHVNDWIYEERIGFGDEPEERTLTVQVGEAVIRGKASPGVHLYVNGIASKSGKADESGHFEIRDVPPGTWRVGAWTKDLTCAPVTVGVTGTESPEPITLEMVVGARILVVFREPDRAAMEQAEIRLFDEQGRKWFLRKEATADYDRRSTPLVPGRYEIEVTTASGKSMRTTVLVKAGEKVRVEVGAP